MVILKQSGNTVEQNSSAFLLIRVC